jgi:hypothetical protein
VQFNATALCRRPKVDVVVLRAKKEKQWRLRSEPKLDDGKFPGETEGYPK